MVGADFDQQLNGLEREIGMLAEIVERAVQRAIEALKSGILSTRWYSD